MNIKSKFTGRVTYSNEATFSTKRPPVIHVKSTCSICDKYISTVNSALLMPTTDLGCEKCDTLFLICKECSTEKCPNCNGNLVSEKFLFPSILRDAIRSKNSASVIALLNSLNCEYDDITIDNSPLLFLFLDNPKMCLQFIETYNMKTDITNRDGDTLLILMFKYGGKLNNKLVKKLADTVDCQGYGGRTALMWPAIDARFNAASMLIDLGANALLKDRSGHTALGISMANYSIHPNQGNTRMVEYLRTQMIKQFSVKHPDIKSSFSFTKEGDIISGSL